MCIEYNIFYNLDSFYYKVYDNWYLTVIFNGLSDNSNIRIVMRNLVSTDHV